LAKKILVIDDEVALVDMLAVRLEANGYEILKALDGKEGYEKAQTHLPDAIILDLRMPRMDGFQVCRLIKFDDALKDVKVIILTAHSSENDRKSCLTVGADALLSKPYDYDELLQTIKRLVGE
jgi:DNA-binding response OmpR family regulator